MTEENPLAETKRQLDLAVAALQQPGAGTLANLECRVADLQQRLLTAPAATLADVSVRLTVIRQIVSTLGEPGYLLHLVDRVIEDVRTLERGSPPA